MRALGLLLSAAALSVEGVDDARTTACEYASGSGDFADYFPGRRNRGASCETTFTLDGALSASESFTVL